MGWRVSPLKGWYGWFLVMWGIMLVLPVHSWASRLSDAEVARQIQDKNNQVIIEAFLVHELREVNVYATQPLLSAHPSLEFFMKQVDRGPLKSLFFLEEQVHKLQDAQRNIDSLPMTVAFSAGERKKLMALKPTADKIISFGIPLMKRDFMRVVEAAKALADRRRKHPMELIPNRAFRDEIYRTVESTPKGLDTTMGELSEGEEICMGLGWTLETITVTRLWLTLNDNTLPKRSDYMAYRKKRSEYFINRLKEIYGAAAVKEAGLDKTSKR
jgi:hypothetical protein